MRVSQTSPAPSRELGEVLVDGLSHDGRGLARSRGKTLFIDGALPGEKVVATTLDERRRYINARVKTVVEPSPQRVMPPCRHFKQCGGCSLQYWSHEGQLEGKQAIVLDQLRRFSSIEPEEISAPLESEPYGYRHRARLAIRWRKGRLALGFREQQSQAICAIQECPVLAPSLQALPGQLRTILPELQKKEAVSHAELFLADSGRGLLLRHIRPLPENDQQLLEDFAREQQLHLYLQGAPDQVNCRYKPGDDPWLYNRIPEFDLDLQFRPTDFTQVNWSLNRKMVIQANQWLQPGSTDKVLDLFCGLGNFSLALARTAQSVTGVEGGAGAVVRAGHNAVINQLDNCLFHQADLSALSRGKGWLSERYDALLLDPPRTGALEIIEQMAGQLPDRLLYISCNPATLARDAGALDKAGFALKRLGVMDMFPQTAHVESMALFLRR